VQNGILLASLVTAALANLMRLNPSEFSGLSIMAREAARIDMREHAADIIILTWKRWKGKRLSRTQRNHGRMWHLKAEFQEARIKSMIEIADCVSLSGKLEKISRSTKLINKCVNQLSAVLWRPLEESPLATSGRGTLRSRVPPSEPHSASFRSSSKLLRADSMSSIGSSASVVAARARAERESERERKKDTSERPGGPAQAAGEQRRPLGAGNVPPSETEGSETSTALNAQRRPPPGQNEEVTGLIGFTLYSI